MRPLWAIAAVVMVLLPGGGAVVYFGEPVVGKADRVVQWASERVPLLPAVRLPDAVADGDEIVREFTWVYRGVPYAWRVGFDAEAHADYVARPRTMDPRAYGAYVTLPGDDPSVARVAAGLDALARERGYGEEERANLALAFVQGLAYVLDWDASGADDYPKFPIETLVDEGGDCEDTSALFASLARALGVDATLLLLDGHMAGGVKLDESVRGRRFDGYLYAETTRAGYRVGEVAWAFRDSAAKPLAAVAVPALDVRWSARANEWGFLVRVDVWNNGTATAEGVNLYAGATLRESPGEWRGAFVAVGDVAPGRHAARWVWVDVRPSHAATVRAVAWADGLHAVGGDRSAELAAAEGAV